MRIFKNFAEIEADIRDNAPKTVYKYRSWQDDFHKKLLCEQQLWFPHPFDLNDPIDLRPEIFWDQAEVFDSRFLQKLYDSVSEMHPSLNTVYEKRIVAENQWDILIQNPTTILNNRNEHEHERRNYERYGVFSTSTDGLIDRMWEEYGDNSKGFCVGFNTVEICRNIKSGYGFVSYSDVPRTYTFFKDDYESDHEFLYVKKRKWKHEKEFRFLTVGIGTYIPKRIQIYSPNAVSEILLGLMISSKVETEILSEVNRIWPHGLPVFKVLRDKNGILFKNRIR